MPTALVPIISGGAALLGAIVGAILTARWTKRREYTNWLRSERVRLFSSLLDACHEQTLASEPVMPWALLTQVAIVSPDARMAAEVMAQAAVRRHRGPTDPRGSEARLRQMVTESEWRIRRHEFARLAIRLVHDKKFARIKTGQVDAYDQTDAAIGIIREQQAQMLAHLDELDTSRAAQ